MSDSNKPCANCPWRKTTPKKGFPGGIIDARRLMEMVEGGLDQPAMGCHSRDGVCVGFALVIGPECLGYRRACSLGYVNHGSLEADGELHTLFSVLETHGGIPDGEHHRSGGDAGMR